MTKLTLDDVYSLTCSQVSDINELIPVLRGYGEQCRHITEFGIGFGNSAIAWLASKPEKLVCYDIGRRSCVDDIARLAKENGIVFEFHEENTANVIIKPTDLLFIDTIHGDHQLSRELWMSYNQVRKFIIVHDTDTYGVKGESGDIGMWITINRFCLDKCNAWKIREVRPESNGLTVLERIPCP